MSTASTSTDGRRALKGPLLVNGDRLTQAEFHRRYAASPENTKFELIGGIVYMASPLRRPHARYHPVLSGALMHYSDATPGTELLDNATTILGEESEPQPDLELRVLSEFGGRSRETDDEYVEGSPEMMAEIAYSSRAIDLNQKREDYERAGVCEYLVVSVEEPELHWFNFRTGRPIRPDRQGIARSRIFPGLWVDVQALLDCNFARLIEVIQQGLVSPEHGRFLKRLEATRRRRSRG